MRQETHIAVGALALVSAAVVLGVLLGPGVAEAGHGSSANFTFEPVDAPADRKPGIDDASYKQWAHSNVNIKSVDYFIIQWDDGDLSGCSSSDVQTLAIDRGDDQSGMGNDEGLLQYVEDSTRKEHRVVVDFYDDDDIYDSTHLNKTDEIVAHQTDCYGNPDDPGWYQITATINGTGWNGQPVTSTVDSHYFWICDCQNEQEARERLGPPPSEQNDGSATSPTPTPSATATSTPVPTTATSSPVPTTTTSTPVSTTATSTSVSTTDPSPTPSATRTPASESNTAPASSTAATSTPVPTTDSGSTPSATRAQSGQAEGGSGGSETGAGGASTPTVANGPGFGMVAAICALIGTIFIQSRRVY
jgi:hypothetical protein